jgi:alkylhydroperoxidase/carboxymuconolactone decarboxylase family protein YurZ
MENNPERLNTRQQNLVVISAYASKGDRPNLKIALNKALEAGLTINEINEALAHLYAYIGFPRSIRGVLLFKEVVQERNASGVKDEKGRDATPVALGSSKYERGEKTQVTVTGLTTEQLVTMFDFNPIMDVFLKEHLFGDIFDRDILSFIDREIVTVSVLASVHDPFVRSHIEGAFNVGVTEEQLKELFSIIEERIGKAEADTARKVLAEVTASRNR